MINPIQLIKAQMHLKGLSQADLARVLRLNQGTIYKMLNYQLKLSVTTIRKLNEEYDIPLKMLIQDYPLYNKPKAK